MSAGIIRRLLRVEDGPVTASPRRGPLIAQAAGDEWQAPLPGWRFRSHGRPIDTMPEPGLSAAPASAGGEFRADRGAARYAPAGAVFAVRDRRFPVVTVSLSGFSIEWDPVPLPAVGASVEGVVQPGSAAGDFPASLLVVRLDPGRRLVAGRFAGLRDRSIDNLLNWLVQLERNSPRG